MATSGVTAHPMTALDMVTEALVELGIIESGETPDASDLERGIARLNALLKSWQAKGVNLWREQDTSITVTGGTATVSLSAGIRNVFAARHVLSATNERVLGRLERDEYLSLPNKATVGNPHCFYVGTGTGGLTLYVWPVPSTNQTLKIDNERIVETVTAGTEEIDLPEDYYECAWMNLAVRMAPMFGNIDPLRLGEIKSRAGMLERDMLDEDRPSSIMMGAF